MGRNVNQLFSPVTILLRPIIRDFSNWEFWLLRRSSQRTPIWWSFPHAYLYMQRLGGFERVLANHRRIKHPQQTPKVPDCTFGLPVPESRFDWSIVKSVEVMVDILGFASWLSWFWTRSFDGWKRPNLSTDTMVFFAPRSYSSRLVRPRYWKVLGSQDRWTNNVLGPVRTSC